MKPSLILSCFLLAGATLLAANPDEARAEAEKLMQRAHQAKSEGRFEEAQDLARKARELRGEVARGKIQEEART